VTQPIDTRCGSLSGGSTLTVNLLQLWKPFSRPVVTKCAPRIPRDPQPVLTGSVD